MVGTMGYATYYLMKQVRKIVNSGFTFAGVNFNNVSLRSIDLTLFFGIENNSDISVIVSKQEYDVFLNGEYIKTIGNPDDVKVRANTDNRVPVRVSLTPADLLKVGLNNYDKFLSKQGRRNLVMEVKGNMDVRTDIFSIGRIPFEFKDDVQSMMEY